nr:hypothetical protein [Streptomyces sp. alain-838]
MQQGSTWLPHPGWARNMAEPSPRHALWRQFEDEHDVWLIGDVCKGVRMITEGDAAQPHDAIALSIAGAEATEGVLVSLDSEWALYTPQQVAYAASALFAQITAAGLALEKLDAHLDVMAERGDIAMPDMEQAARDEGGEAGRIGLAQMAMGSVGYAASTIVPPSAEEAVRLLAAAQRLAPLPANAHETVTEVGHLLGDEAKIFTAHHDGDAQPTDHDREHCGCRIELTTPDGTLWDFRRHDGQWCLTRMADLHTVELAAGDACADPRHLAALLRQATQTTP